MIFLMIFNDIYNDILKIKKNMIKVNIKVHRNYLKQLQEKAESYVMSLLLSDLNLIEKLWDIMD